MTEPAGLSIPELVILPEIEADACRFDPAADKVLHAWTTVEGEVIAHSGELSGRQVMHIAGVGTYRADPGADIVEVAPEPGVAREVVDEGYYRAALPFLLQLNGTEAIHASAIESSSGVILLCGVSGAGKSTLAYGLSQRGLPVRADDVVAFRAESDPVLVLPLPFSIRLMPDAAALYPSRAGGLDPKSSHPLESEHDSGPRPLALGLCLTDERSRNSEIEISRLTAADAFSTVLSHAYCFDPDRISRKESLVRDYLSLTAKVPFFSVSLGDDLGALEERLDVLEELLRVELGARALQDG